MKEYTNDEVLALIKGAKAAVRNLQAALSPIEHLDGVWWAAGLIPLMYALSFQEGAYSERERARSLNACSERKGQRK